ncbi:hypothetical protein Tco_1500339 [Tanacetum coccineum]
MPHQPWLNTLISKTKLKNPFPSADEDTLTMAQLLEATPPRVTRMPSVVPEIDADNFELKHVPANLVQNNNSFGHRPKKSCMHTSDISTTRHVYDEDPRTPEYVGEFQSSPAYQPPPGSSKVKSNRHGIVQPPALSSSPANQAPAPQIQGVSKEDFQAYIKANDAVMRNMQTQGQNLQTQLNNLATSNQRLESMLGSDCKVAISASRPNEKAQFHFLQGRNDKDVVK